VTRKLFEEAVQDLVLRPAGMADSLFAQPLPTTLVPRAATGHDSPLTKCLFSPGDGPCLFLG
jgi:hypothetical protein